MSSRAKWTPKWRIGYVAVAVAVPFIVAVFVGSGVERWVTAAFSAAGLVLGGLIGFRLRQDRDRDYEEWRNRWH